MSNSSELMKPLITGGLVVAIDQLYFKEPDMVKSLTFGGATSASVYVANKLSSSLPNLGKFGFVDSKKLEIRVLEIGLGAGGAYAINRFALKNDFQYSQMVPKIVSIAAADVVAEYFMQYLDGGLSFLG